MSELKTENDDEVPEDINEYCRSRDLAVTVFDGRVCLIDRDALEELNEFRFPKNISNEE